MERFKDLEQNNKGQSVRLASPYRGSGILDLAGTKTSVRLTSRDYIVERDPLSGWFDLVVERGSKEKILLQNSILTSMEAPHPDEWELRVFPNLIAFNAETLLPRKKVRRLTFTADGLEDVFAYDLIEWQSLYEAPKNTLEGIRALRRKEPYPRSYDIFAPSDLYLIHKLPRVLRIDVDNRIYEIFLGWRQSGGRRGLRIRPIAYATIRFKEPTSIDDALDYAWAWRRFFNQLAMQLLPFTGLSCSGRLNRRAPSSSLYLPNLGSELRRDNEGRYSFSSRDVPFGDWKNRKHFAAVMTRWLKAENARRLFRSRLDQVLEQSRETSSPRFVAELCNAVDTLAEFKRSSTLTKSDIDKIVAGAEAAASNASIEIEKGRIRGVVSLLQHQSLPQKLKALAAQVALPDAKKVLRVFQIAQSFRTFDAHGGHWDDMTMPLVGPTLEAMKGICVLWDQLTCGMPLTSGDRSLLSARIAQSQVDEVCHRSEQIELSSA